MNNCARVNPFSTKPFVSYDDFLSEFISIVEYLSGKGEGAWGAMYQRLDVFFDGDEQGLVKCGWVDRERWDEHLLHVQGYYLVKSGLYESHDLPDYKDDFWYFGGVDEPTGWRSGRESSVSFLRCKGDKSLIASLFIYMSFGGGLLKNCYLDDDRYVSRIGGLGWRSGYPGNFIISGARQMLSDHGVPLPPTDEYRGLPRFAPAPFSNAIFDSHQEAAHYLAERFVMLVGKLVVCSVNLSKTKDHRLMRRLSEVAKINRIRFKLKQELDKVKSERDKVIREQKYNKAIEVHDRYCEELHVYADPLPEIFSRLRPLCHHWDHIGKGDLATLLWSAPLSIIGPMFGKSDNGVRKKAIRMKIPIPRRGMWNSIREGGTEYPEGRVIKEWVRAEKELGC